VGIGLLFLEVLVYSERIDTKENILNPILLSIGSFHLSYYGLFYGLAILVVYTLAKRELGTVGVDLNDDELLNVMILTFLGAIAGSRLYYVALNWEYYSSTKTPWYEFAMIWHGGLAVHGGLLTGCLSLWLVCRVHPLPFKQMADLFAPGLLLGQGIGRLGSFMNGESFGSATSLPWGVIFRYGQAAKDYPGVALHPVMLYEALADLVGFLLLYWTGRKQMNPGFTAALYLSIYGVIRFGLSFLRVDDLLIGGVKGSQMWSILMVTLSLALIFGLELYRKEEIPQKKEEQQFLPKRQWKL